MPEFTGDGGGDRQTTPYAYPTLEKWSAKSLIENLLPDVGASLPYRDLADCYMVDEVLSFGKKGKLITNENELPIGVPTSWSFYKGEKRVDTDNDGMPDEWETANGTNPNANDAMTIAENGYANIENYINGITKDNRQYFLRAPLLPSLESSTTNSLTISWYDFTDNEDGFIVEMQKDGAFVEVGRIEHAIAITILPVVCTIEMEVGITTCQTITTHGRTIDEKVVLDVTIGSSLRITTHVISGILPVIDQVVHILVDTLHF